MSTVVIFSAVGMMASSAAGLGRLLGGLARLGLDRIPSGQAWTLGQGRMAALNSRIETLLGPELSLAQLPTPAQAPALEIRRLEAMLQAYLEVPEFKVATERLKAPELAALSAEVRELKTSLAAVASPAESLAQAARAGQARLESLASGVQESLCRVERQALAETMTLALGELGYRVELQGEALRASLGQTWVWAKLEASGGFALDFSGHSDLACLQELDRLEAAFRKHGLILERTAVDHHHRPQGGAIVQRLTPLFPVFRKAYPQRKTHRRAQALGQRR